ncbi:gephyrin-like molybdotransferase Glp [Gulosibacter sp. 10]|uniref:molybdopterin molybdotransferase MoeA n=1 Tax=Gulosibacter sp. 10 TaxID=1255570 RepID=UPI00097E8E3C|nr:gephyrin-like molybdotransferase Glp [Gulosibacter sp. 10]SJM70991.1 Molybdopterin biosynthesis protein MoeA [Gulosibacter sp. 10]
MIPFDGQLAAVIAAAEPLAPRRVPLAEARGLRLAERVVSSVPLPGFDNSAMDGFAVRREDVLGAGEDAPVELRVVADVPAGSGANPPLGPGECARVMTGSPVPADADAIVPFEATAQGVDVRAEAASAVAVLAEPKPGAHIRRRGEDAPVGAVVAEPGERLGARVLAGIAAVGVAEIAVRPRPRVALIATGDELVRPGGELEHGRLYDSNTTLVRGLVEEADAELVGEFRAGDGGGEFATAVERAAGLADVIVTTGGVSVGAFDVVRIELEGAADATAGVRFDKVAMQPGKPQGFGRLASGALVFALPGNPVSVFTSFEAFVRPALGVLRGDGPEPRRVSEAEAAEGWRCPPGRLQFMPVRFSAPGRVVPATAGGSGSHLVSRLAAAEAIALVPAEVDAVRAGDRLTIWEILP